MHDSTSVRPDCSWFRAAASGVFVHYLAENAEVPPASWSARVEAFDADHFAQQLHNAGVPYVFFTIGQNTGHFCSPNTRYEQMVSGGPSRLSRRDLIADVATACHSRGIKLLAYLPSHAPAYDRPAVEALGCTPRWDASQWQLKPGSYIAQRDVDDRLTRFQQNWQGVIQEWSVRWAKLVAGWWIDGCYYADRMYRHTDSPNFQSFAAALRSGNPDAIVAFNPGVRVPVSEHTEHEDFTAGEVADQLPVCVWKKTADGPLSAIGANLPASIQLHLLSFLGYYWGRGTPRFSDALAAGYTRYVHEQGGVMTWDVPVGHTGIIPSAFLSQLEAIRAQLPHRGETIPG